MRKAVKSRPESNAKAYVKFVLAFKADVESCNTMDEIKAFYAGNPDNLESAGIFEYLKKASLDPKDKRWSYTDDVTKPFFSGKEILRYVYHTLSRCSCQSQKYMFSMGVLCDSICQNSLHQENQQRR